MTGTDSGTVRTHSAAARSQAPAENSSAGVTKFTPPMPNSAISAALGLAVPMSMPL